MRVPAVGVHSARTASRVWDPFVAAATESPCQVARRCALSKCVLVIRNRVEA